MASITRRDRLVDLAALALMVAGAGVYLDGTARLQAIAQLTFRHPGPRGVRQVMVADRARYEANAGMALVVLGGLAGAASAIHVRRRNRTG